MLRSAAILFYFSCRFGLVFPDGIATLTGDTSMSINFAASSCQFDPGCGGRGNNHDELVLGDFYFSDDDRGSDQAGMRL